MKDQKQEFTRFLRFATVGAIGAVVDFGIFNLLTSLVGMKASVAQAFSFICAVVSNFIFNRFWTYPDSRSKKVTRQILQFVIVSIIGLAIRTPMFTFLETVYTNLFRRILPENFLSPVFVGHNLALATAILVVMFWNFIANRYWTYNDVDNRPTIA